MALKVGDTAPAFELVSDQKEQVKLSDYKGKNVVLLFFPLAFTGVCTKELCIMRDDFSGYEDLNAQILAVSVDSPFVLEKFKKEHKLNFPLLSDFNKEVSRMYDALYEKFVFDMKGVSKRAAYVLDKNGTIQYAEVLESAGDLPNFEAIKNSLASLNS